MWFYGMIVDQPLHGGLQDTPCFHTALSGNDRQDVSESVSDRPDAVETVDVVVGVSADDVAKKGPEGVEHQVVEIGIGVQIFADETAVLCTKPVREGLCIDTVDQFVARAPESCSSQLPHAFGHLPADKVRDQPFAEIASASLVAEDEAQ